MTCKILQLYALLIGAMRGEHLADACRINFDLRYRLAIADH